MKRRDQIRVRQLRRHHTTGKQDHLAAHAALTLPGQQGAADPATRRAVDPVSARGARATARLASIRSVRACSTPKAPPRRRHVADSCTVRRICALASGSSATACVASASSRFGATGASSSGHTTLPPELDHRRFSLRPTDGLVDDDAVQRLINAGGGRLDSREALDPLSRSGSRLVTLTPIASRSLATGRPDEPRDLKVGDGSSDHRVITIRSHAGATQPLFAALSAVLVHADQGHQRSAATFGAQVRGPKTLALSFVVAAGTEACAAVHAHARARPPSARRPRATCVMAPRRSAHADRQGFRHVRAPDVTRLPRT